MKSKVVGGIMGLCVADALGVPVEFISREVLRKNPVKEMREYGTYNQPIGTWSDDTSMTICLADSLIHGLDYTEIMRRFHAWINNASYTPHGEVFDVGIATRKALERYAAGKNPIDCGGRNERDNGNGSLMRILPLAYYLHTKYGENITSSDKAMDIVHRVSSMTHAHKRSQIACGIYVSITCLLMGTMSLDYAIHDGIYRAIKYYQGKSEYSYEIKNYIRLTADEFGGLAESQIRSSGYVVDTLEAAIWCLLNTDNYKDCVLKAVNLGDDTDTVAAVAGGLAGLYYGYESIPEEWRRAIVKRDMIITICNELNDALSK